MYIYIFIYHICVNQIYISHMIYRAYKVKGSFRACVFTHAFRLWFGGLFGPKEVSSCQGNRGL